MKTFTQQFDSFHVVDGLPRLSGQYGLGESYLTKLRSGELPGSLDEGIAGFLDPEEFDFKGIKSNYVMFGVAGGDKSVYVLPTGALHAMQGVDKMSADEFDRALEELALYSATVYSDGEVFVGVPRHDGAGARALVARGAAEVSEQKWVNTGNPILRVVGGVGMRTNRALFERAAGFAKFVDGTSTVSWSRETSGAASAGRVRTKNIATLPCHARQGRCSG